MKAILKIFGAVLLRPTVWLIALVVGLYVEATVEQIHIRMFGASIPELVERIVNQ